MITPQRPQKAFAVPGTVRKQGGGRAEPEHCAARARETQAGKENTAHRTEVTTQSTQQVYELCFLSYSELQ